MSIRPQFAEYAFAAHAPEATFHFVLKGTPRWKIGSAYTVVNFFTPTMKWSGGLCGKGEHALSALVYLK